MIHAMAVTALLVSLTPSLGAHSGHAPAVQPFDDAAFLKAIAIGARYEARLSYLVGSQTRNNAVKGLAVRIIVDHISASNGLEVIATATAIQLPTDIDAANRQQLDALRDRTGTDLDRDFVRAIVQRRTACLVLFTRASKEARSPAVRALAAQSLPAIQKHLEMAQAIDK